VLFYAQITNNTKLVGWGMGIGFAPTWVRQVSPLLHMTTVTTDYYDYILLVIYSAYISEITPG